MPGIAVFANPGSGSGEAEDVAECLHSIRDDLSVFSLDDAERAVASNPERIVVAGGDGSVGVAAAVAQRSGVPLGVVPIGTANDFARALGLPLETRPACELALTGRLTRRLELGSVDGRPFVNAASTGLSPVAARRARGLKGALGPLAYAAGALRAGLGASPVHCRVVCDSEPFYEGAAWQVSVGATGAFGGGASIPTDPGDGLLDVLVIEAGSRARLVVHAYGLRTGGIGGQRGVRRARAKTVEVETETGIGFNVDGELVDGPRHRFTAPAAYEVVVG